MSKLNNVELLDVVYPQVLKLVENGLTIEQSLQSIGISRKWFYKYLPDKNKNELLWVKTLQSGKNVLSRFENNFNDEE